MSQGLYRASLVFFSSKFIFRTRRETVGAEGSHKSRRLERTSFLTPKINSNNATISI